MTSFYLFLDSIIFLIPLVVEMLYLDDLLFLLRNINNNHNNNNQSLNGTSYTSKLDENLNNNDFVKQPTKTIIISNILGLIETSLIAVLISNIIVYCFVFLFGTSTYQRKRLFRLVMMGERLIVDKAWQRLKRTMNFSFCFGFVIAMAFWLANLYITLIFTAVWSIQRSAWIASFILCLFFLTSWL